MDDEVRKVWDGVVRFCKESEDDLEKFGRKGIVTSNRAIVWADAELTALRGEVERMRKDAIRTIGMICLSYGDITITRKAQIEISDNYEVSREDLLSGEIVFRASRRAGRE